MVNKIFKYSVYTATGMTLICIVFILGYILFMGVPHLRLCLFEWSYTTDNVSLMPALINTIIMIAVSLGMAIPIGIFTAIFLVEYAGKGNRFVKMIRITMETLAGIPSIIYGLFGMLFFVTALGWGYSILAGACTLAIMVLPMIMRTTEEALLAVPDSFREGSFGLGAGKLRTVFIIILPSAISGITSGIVLAMGRMIGETAALIYTAGTVASIPGSSGLLSSGRTLAIHLYMLAGEALYTKQAYATAVVLIGIVVGMNSLSSMIARRCQWKIL